MENRIRIVITGACGFLGSHVVDAALSAGHEVVALCAYRPDGRVGWMEGYADKVHILRSDVGEPDWFNEFRLDPIINCAALVSVPYSDTMPSTYWATNASAVARMALNCQKLVQVSTSEVFDGKSPPYFDYSRQFPITPYGASKAAGECAALGYSRTARVVRIFNLFGPRQFPRAVHPLFIRESLRVKRGEKKLAELDGPHGSRAFLYAPWVAQQLVKIATSETSQRLIQLASMDVVDIADLWVRVAAAVGIDVEAVLWNHDEGKRGVANLFGASSEGYKTPDYDWGGLDETVRWMEANPHYAAEGNYQ